MRIPMSLIIAVLTPWEIGGAIYTGTHNAAGWATVLTMAAVFSVMYVAEAARA